MQFKLLSCEVLTREVCHAVVRTQHTVDLEFTDKGAHDDADKLRALIQHKIDETEAGNRHYDAILLGYGLCGNALAGIRSQKIQLVIPRAHDCCTLFLGDKNRFHEIFSERPSTPFSSAGYMEHGGTYSHESGDFLEQQGLKASFNEYVEIYGEENAKYLWDTLHTTKNEHSQEIVFIDIPELAHLGFAEKCQEMAEQDNTEYIQVEGSMRLLHKLILGKWDAADFLVIQPGENIEAVYDWEEIMRSKKT